MKTNKYDLNIKEEQLKNEVRDDFFYNFDNSKIVQNIDFSIAVKSTDKNQGEFFEMPFLLFGEAKRGNKHNIIESFVQLILTIGNNSINGDKIYTIYSPEYLCAFDAEKIAFIPYEKVKHIFYKNDFDWNIIPSNHKSKEFKELQNIIQPLLENENLQFNYLIDEAELKDFISKNLVINSENKLYQITKNNFIDIYYKWRKIVLPTIEVDWKKEAKKGIIDADFYLADLISNNNESIKKDLFVVLQKNYYEYNKTKIENFLGLYQAHFNDKQKAHKQFWQKYKRPPLEDVQNYIIERRDLLVPPNIRERKGSFFTPQIWREKAHEYLAKTFGNDWQEKYYIWDCAAGTGNLLVGLTEQDNIFASTLDKADVDIIKEFKNIPENHIFQFDFLNDDFKSDKVPAKLKNILNSEEERKKLIIFINPPYAEAGHKRELGSNKKSNVSNKGYTYEKYKGCIGNASNELFAQFFIRIYKEIPDCILASFSTLKYVNSQNFKKFREVFKAKFLKGFICPADTFDNVQGKFPIGFLIWDLSNKKELKKVNTKVFDSNCKFIQNKSFYPSTKLTINKWLINFFDNENTKTLFYLVTTGVDFQHNNFVALINEAGTSHMIYAKTTKNNLLPISIYFAVRHCIKATWLNDRDQFLYPKKGWENDFAFHGDCLIFTLLHGQNKISSEQGKNYFIPFNSKEMGCKKAPDSNFMSKYLKDFQAGKCQINTPTNLEKNCKNLVENTQNNIKVEFSAQATDVLNAGKQLFEYYHEQTNSQFPNASLYDIKKHFQGVSEKTGKVNSKSDDEKYNDLLQNLKNALQKLAKNIEIKTYEYGFLMQ